MDLWQSPFPSATGQRALCLEVAKSHSNSCAWSRTSALPAQRSPRTGLDVKCHVSGRCPSCWRELGCCSRRSSCGAAVTTSLSGRAPLSWGSVLCRSSVPVCRVVCPVLPTLPPRALRAPRSAPALCKQPAASCVARAQLPPRSPGCVRPGRAVPCGPRLQLHAEAMQTLLQP